MDALERRLRTLRQRVNDDDALVRRGRYVSLVFLLGVGEREYLIAIECGKISDIQPRRLATTSGRFCIRAAPETWAEHWTALPARDYHDLFSMLPKGFASIDGDLLPLMQNLQYFKDVLASAREAGERHATV